MYPYRTNILTLRLLLKGSIECLLYSRRSAKYSIYIILFNSYNNLIKKV